MTSVPRPFRVPLGTVGCTLVILPAVMGIVVVLALASYTTIGVSVLCNITGVAFYYIYQTRRDVCKMGSPQ